MLQYSCDYKKYTVNVDANIIINAQCYRHTILMGLSLLYFVCEHRDSYLKQPKDIKIPKQNVNHLASLFYSSKQ